MAEDLGISPSYVALLERNQRPVTADLLLRLARGYDLEITDLASQDSDDYARRIADVLRDPIFAGIDMPALEVADLASSFPGVSEALLRLHAAYMREQRALVEQRDTGADDAGSNAVTEARLFMAGQGPYFAILDDMAEALAEEIDAGGGSESWLKARGQRVRFMPPEVMMDAVRRYDRHAEQLLIVDTLDAPARAQQLVLHIAYTTMRAEIAGLLRGGSFATPTAANLVRRTLATYGAAALLMPYTRFFRAAESRGYDVTVLASLFGTDFESTAHRLATLQRPGQEGVRFFFIRIDGAGNVTKRLDGAGFPFAAPGGGCPLWSIHAAACNPGSVLTQWLEMPGGKRFFSVARAAATGGTHSWNTSPGDVRTVRTVALVCAADDAPKLTLSRGADQRTAPATPVGITCRLCYRADCTARVAPPLGREILPDDYRRTTAPFTFAEE